MKNPIRMKQLAALILSLCLFVGAAVPAAAESEAPAVPDTTADTPYSPAEDSIPMPSGGQGAERSMPMPKAGTMTPAEEKSLLRQFVELLLATDWSDPDIDLARIQLPDSETLRAFWEYLCTVDGAKSILAGLARELRLLLSEGSDGMGTVEDLIRRFDAEAFSQQVESSVQEASRTVDQWAQGAESTVENALQEASRAVGEWAQDAGEAAAEWAQTAGEAVDQWAQSAEYAVGQWAQGAEEAFSGLIENLGSLFGN